MAQDWPDVPTGESLNQSLIGLITRTDTLGTSFSGSTAPPAVVGRVWFNTSDNNYYVCINDNPATWVTLSGRKAVIKVDADCDYVEFTGLSVARDLIYGISLRVYNPTSGGVQYYIGVNGDYDLNNYTDTTGLGLSIFNADAGTEVTRKAMACEIQITDSKPSLWGGSILYDHAVTDVTTIRIWGDSTGSIGAGSWFILYY